MLPRISFPCNTLNNSFDSQGDRKIHNHQRKESEAFLHYYFAAARNPAWWIQVSLSFLEVAETACRKQGHFGQTMRNYSSKPVEIMGFYRRVSCGEPNKKEGEREEEKEQGTSPAHIPVTQVPKAVREESFQPSSLPLFGCNDD